MNAKLWRIILIELVGSFGLVLFSSGLVCINHMTAPQPTQQPGLVGIALGQGLILAALLALTAPVTGGYLNPAVTLMLWVFNRIESPRAFWLGLAQFVGGILGEICLKLIFANNILDTSHYGAPHVNPEAYPASGQATLFTGAALELLLTFFLVFAIFGTAGTEPLKLGIVTGVIMTVCALFGFPLTGAALNPARWLGPTLLEAYFGKGGAWSDTLVYLAGPILGALLGGGFVFKIYRNEGIHEGHEVHEARPRKM